MSGLAIPFKGGIDRMNGTAFMSPASAGIALTMALYARCPAKVGIDLQEVLKTTPAKTGIGDGHGLG